MRALALVAVVATTAACHARPHRLVTEDEIAALEKALFAELDGNRAGACVRPVLRGEPTAGPADADLLALLHPSGAVGDCFDALHLDKLTLDQELWACTPQERAPDAMIEACVPVPLDEPRANGPDVARLAGQCSDAVSEAIARAVAHADACSPWMPGRHAEDATRYPTMFTPAVVLAARARARTDAPAALRLLLDAIRLAHDLARSGTYTAAMITVSLEHRLAPVAHLILDDVPAAELEALAGEIDRLQATRPAFAEIVHNDSRVGVMEIALPGLMPADWTPPWGWWNGQDPRKQASDGRAHLKTRDSGFDERDELALSWLAAEEERRAEEAACPAGAGLKACNEGLIENDEALVALRAKLDRERADLKGLVSGHDSPEAIRAQVIELLRVIATPKRRLYSRRWAYGAAILTGLRLHVEARRLGCPDAAALARWASPPGLGDALRVTGAYEVSLGEWADMHPPEGAPPRRVPVARFHCAVSH